MMIIITRHNAITRSVLKKAKYFNELLLLNKKT